MKSFLLILLLITTSYSAIQYPTPEDLKVIDQLSYLSFATYCDSRILIGSPQWNCGEMCQDGPRLKDVKFCITQNRNYAMMGYDTKSNSINIVFRGTISTSFQNWMSNVDFKKTNLGIAACPLCEVHNGFFDSYKDLRGCMVDRFLETKQLYPGATVRITGHSLGGALATFGAVDLKIMANITPDYFVTFGQPKVGNLEFQRFFNLTIKPVKAFRVTHFRDPVPFLPMEIQGFKHISTNIAYNQDSTEYHVSESDYYQYGASISDHLTYMGRDWETIQASQTCNYPDKTIVPSPYRNIYSKYLIKSNCQNDNKAKNGNNAAGCTADGCFIQKVNSVLVEDTLYNGKCYQTMGYGYSEAQALKYCDLTKIHSNPDGSFCCRIEKYGSLLSSVTVESESAQLGKKNYCKIKQIVG